MFVKIGTGIGSGFVAGATCTAGADGAAGDIGHIHVPDHDDIVCRCGNVGCLEAIAGGARSAGAAGRDRPGHPDQQGRRRPGPGRAAGRGAAGPPGRACHRWRAGGLRQHAEPGGHRDRRRRGRLSDIALNRLVSSTGTLRYDDEFAGATFDPSGHTLYVNIQASRGMTFAIWGPWAKIGV